MENGQPPREVTRGRVYSASIIQGYADAKCFAEAFAAADAWVDESIALLFGVVFSQVSPSIIAHRLIQSGKSSISLSMLYSMRDFIDESPLFADDGFKKRFRAALRGVESFKSWRNLVVHNYGYRKLAILRQHKDAAARAHYLSDEGIFSSESERILNQHLADGISCVKQLQELYKEALSLQK
ncbi:MAG: hypothetical protein N3G76_01710 [Candidatus Micrarchaeota archaeon]|nr:hypothetical protein [Candidatus Micrarchaeota archaeon]